MTHSIFLLLSSLSAISSAQSPSKPNIVFLVFDDVSFADVSYNGGPIPTPLIDTLANDNAIKLNFHYTETTCSPSRSSLYTGRYAFKSGLNQNVNPRMSRTFDPNLVLYPQLLHDNGYKTFFAGKWHIGYKNSNSIPSSRGFDAGLYPIGVNSRYDSRIVSHEFADYDASYPTSGGRVLSRRDQLFNPVTSITLHAFFEIVNGSNVPAMIGSDTFVDTLYTNAAVDFIHAQTHNDPFYVHYNLKSPHSPLTEPPALDPNWMYDYTVCNVPRLPFEQKLYCRMLLYAQERVDEIIEAVQYKGFYDNTIFVLLSDNANNVGMAAPLRGGKNGFNEGSIRGPAFMFGGYIEGLLSTAPSTQCEYNGMVHISDWYNIFTDFADITHSESDIDHSSLEIWDDIQCSCGIYPDCNDGTYTKRTEMISMRVCGSNSDSWPDKVFHSSYIVQYPWKLIVNGSIGGSGAPSSCNPTPNTVSSWNRINAYINFDDIDYTIPNQTFYDTYYAPMMSGGEYDHLYKSQCIESLDGTTDINDENYGPFVYDQFLLYNIETDKIEACNVAADNQQIVDHLWNELQVRSMEYNAGPPEEPENPGAMWAQIHTYECDTGYMYPASWDGLNGDICGNGTEYDVNARDCRDIWRALADIKAACPSTSTALNIPLVEGQGITGLYWGLALGIGGIVSMSVVYIVLTKCNLLCCGVRNEQELPKRVHSASSQEIESNKMVDASSIQFEEDEYDVVELNVTQNVSR